MFTTIRLIVLILVSIITISLLFNKEILDYIDSICQNVRSFIAKNSGFFTIFFLGLFFIEQIFLILIVFSFFDSVPNNLELIISIFALVVVTTATIQKFVWEYKYNSAKNKSIVTTYRNKQFLNDMKDLINENFNLRKELKKKR